MRSAGLKRAWVLLTADPGVAAVNGAPVVLGMRVLVDRDELTIRESPAGQRLRLFFSNERLTRAERFPASKGPVPCPRCKQPIRKGDMAVQCPTCDVWHHEREGLACWSYDVHCATGCGQHTEKAGIEFKFHPEVL